MAGIDPQTLQQRSEAAQALIDAGDYDGAIAAFEAIVAEEPENEFILRILGYIYNEVGRDADSVHMLERAMDIDPMIHQIKNAVFFRTQVTNKILAGLDPNEPWPSEAEA